MKALDLPLSAVPIGQRIAELESLVRAQQHVIISQQALLRSTTHSVELAWTAINRLVEVMAAEHEPIPGERETLRIPSSRSRH